MTRYASAVSSVMCGTALSLAALGCSSNPEPIVDCRDERGIHPICGFQNPEDISVLADNRRLIVSQYGDMTKPEGRGSLALLDLGSDSMRIVYPPAANGAGASTKAPGWGDADCEQPADNRFNPHGIDLAARPDGRLQLLVVNHGDAERIEFFEVLPEPNNVHVVWRGCAVPPEGAWLNDVVNLPDGGLLASHMMEYGGIIWNMLKATLGAKTGFVYEWHAASGFTRVSGTDRAFPNGIEVSDDGREIFLNVYMGDVVERIDRSNGKVLASAKVAAPDNSAWAKDGRLLVASHLGGFREQRPCLSLDDGRPCPMSFEIRALDPKTLEGEAIFANRGAPMGGGTVAVDVGGKLVIGSFAGDRVIVAPINEK